MSNYSHFFKLGTYNTFMTSKPSASICSTFWSSKRQEINKILLKKYSWITNNLVVIAWFVCISQKFLYWGLITEISVPPSTENFYETSLCHECIIQPRFVCTVKIIVKSKLTYFVDVWQAFVDMVLKNIEIRDWTREVILILWFQEYLCNSKFYQSTLITQKEIMQFWLGQFTNAKMCKCIFESIVECILYTVGRK